MHPSEQEIVRALLTVVICEEISRQSHLCVSEFAVYWMSQDAFVVRAVEPDKYKPKEILGALYWKPNFPDRLSHICNAGFIVQLQMRSQGIGRLMGEAMLKIAASLS